MYTRKDYMKGRATHAEYYGQFVDDHTRNWVLTVIGLERLLKSTDEYLNDIPLDWWDSYARGFPSHIGDKVRAAGDFVSLATVVCIAKQAAKQIIAEQKIEVPHEAKL